MAKRVLLGFPIGNTVIGELVEETAEGIVLKNPMEVMTLPVENRVQISIIPFKFIYSESTTKQVTINANKTLFVDDLANFPSLESGYEEELNKIAEKAKANKPQIIT